MQKPNGLPDYPLRLTIAAVVIFAVLAVALYLMGPGIYGQTLFWPALAASTIYVSLIVQYNNIPGERRVSNLRANVMVRAPFGIILLVLIIPATRSVAFELVPGFIAGFVLGLGLGMLIMAFTGEERMCTRCGRPHLFVKYKGRRYCNNCGHALDETPT